MSWSALRFVGGRLALDFVNIFPINADLSWDQLIVFLESARIVTPERGGELRALSHSDPQGPAAWLRPAYGIRCSAAPAKNAPGVDRAGE